MHITGQIAALVLLTAIALVLAITLSVGAYQTLVFLGMRNAVM